MSREISREQHAAIGRILGYPACCVAEWVAECGSGDCAVRRGTLTVRRRPPAEVRRVEEEVSALLGWRWSMLSDTRKRWVPCTACAATARQLTSAPKCEMISA